MVLRSWSPHGTTNQRVTGSFLTTIKYPGEQNIIVGFLLKKPK